MKSYPLLLALFVAIVFSSCSDFNTFEVKGRVTATSECKGSVLPPYDITVEISKGNRKIINTVTTDNNGRFGFDFPWIEKKSAPEKWKILSVYKDGSPICDVPKGCDSTNHRCYNHAKNKESYVMDEEAEYTVICKCGPYFTIDLFDPFGTKKKFSFGEPGYYFLPPIPTPNEVDSTKPFILDDGTDSLPKFWIWPKRN